MLETIRTALQSIPEAERQAAMNLIIGIAQMLDMMGARGQEDIQGSLTFTRNMHIGSKDMLASILLLENAASIQPAFEDYLQRRACHIGFADYKTIYPSEAQSQVFMRFVCKLRIFEPEKAQVLKQAFDTMSSEGQGILAEELSFSETHGIDSFTTAPNYEATGFHNISKVAREITRNYEEEVRLALNYGLCFANVVKEMQLNYSEVCQSNNPISFGKLAFLANEYPHFFEPSTFSATTIIHEDQLQEKHKKEFGGKPFVELVLPKTYKKPLTLSPPYDPLSTIASRRSPCYGFTTVAYIEQFPDVNALLMQVRDDIIHIVDPERRPENCPRKRPELIKTTSLHATFYGSAPFIRQSDYCDFFKSDTGLNNGAVLETIKEKLERYLTELEPQLAPIDLEFKEEDGTILARYRVITKDNDPCPLVSLKKLLDTDKFGAASVGDPNPLRDATVVIVLCVVAIKERPEDVFAIKHLLKRANEDFKKLGQKSVERCAIIGQYNKQTLTKGKHAEISYEVEKKSTDSSFFYN